MTTVHDFILAHFDAFRAVHVIAVISWMAGLLYLPRIFVYHASAAKGSALSETFKVMERKLLRFIMNPAMIVTWIFGICLLYARSDFFAEAWMHVKLTAVILMTVFHHALGRWRKAFLHDKNKHTAAFYRRVNEIPTVLMIVIVVMVIVKP